MKVLSHSVHNGEKVTLVQLTQEELSKLGQHTKCSLCIYSEFDYVLKTWNADSTSCTHRLVRIQNVGLAYPNSVCDGIGIFMPTSYLPKLQERLSKQNERA